MFFLYGNNSGSPILARKSAPLFTVILILGIIIGIVVALGILISKIREYKKSDKYIEKEKDRITTYSDIVKYANQNEFSSNEKAIFWEICQITRWKNIFYTLKDNSSVNELFRKAYYIMKEKKDLSDKKLNLFFKTLFKIETIVAQYRKLISSKQIPLQSMIFYISDEGEQYPFTIIQNTKDFFVIEIPEFIAKTQRRPPILKQSRFTYKTNDGLSHNFVTRIIRYDENDPKQIKAIIAHTDKLECQTLRKFKREFFEEKCQFSAVIHNQSGQNKYVIKSEKLEGKITNISGGGCCIRTNLPIKENQYLCIFLESIGINEKLIGIIRRTRKLPNGTFSLHIQFLDLPISIENKILALVYKYEL